MEQQVFHICLFLESGCGLTSIPTIWSSGKIPAKFMFPPRRKLTTILQIHRNVIQAVCFLGESQFWRIAFLALAGVSRPPPCSSSPSTLPTCLSPDRFWVKVRKSPPPPLYGLLPDFFLPAEGVCCGECKVSIFPVGI